MDRSGGRNFRIAGRRIVALEGTAPKRAGPTIRKLPAGGGCQDWRKIRKIPNLCSRGFAAAVTAIRSRSGVHLSWRPPPQSFEPHAPAMTAPGTNLPIRNVRYTAASLIGHSGSSAFRLSTSTVSMSLTGSCFSSESAPGALPSWDSRTRWNNLSGDLAVNVTAGSSGRTNSPHPSSREGHHSTARWSSSVLLLD
jgi:hypothetical protein